MIHPTPRKIGLLLEGSEKLSVPKYQRKFDWNNNQIGEMMEDLTSSVLSGKPLFLGTIVLHNKSQSLLEIVDGQQRITSFSLLLIACRQLAIKLNQLNQKNAIQDKISFKDEITGDMDGVRVNVSEKIHNVYKYIAADTWDGQTFPDKIGNKRVRNESNKLKPIYEYMYGQISTYSSDELNKFLKAIYSSYVIEIRIDDPLEAFDIFERTNARGLSLNVSDLLKNYLYANSKDKNLVEESWNTLVANSGSTFQRMLKYYWVSKNGYVMKRDLYGKLRSYGKKIGAIELTNELLQFSEYYSAIRSDEDSIATKWLEISKLDNIRNNTGYKSIFNNVVFALNYFKIAQHIPLIYSMLLSYMRTNQSSKTTKKLLSTLQNIEKYHFINNQICDRVGNEVEKPYAKFAEAFAMDDVNFSEKCNELTTLLKGKLAPREEFIARFLEIEYKDNNIAEFCYIYDRINNYGLKPSEQLKIFDPNKKELHKNYNREHLLSQNPDHEIRDEDAEYIHHFGNIFVIPKHTNSIADNIKPLDKMPIFKDRTPHLRYMRDFIDDFEQKDDGLWGKDEIVRRAEQISAQAYDNVWKLT